MSPEYKSERQFKATLIKGDVLSLYHHSILSFSIRLFIFLGGNALSAQTFIYSSVFPKISLHAFACAGWLTVALDVFQKVKTRLTFQLGSQKKQLSLPSVFHSLSAKKYYVLQQCKSRFKRCLVSNGGTNRLFC